MMMLWDFLRMNLKRNLEFDEVKIRDLMIKHFEGLIINWSNFFLNSMSFKIIEKLFLNRHIGHTSTKCIK